jgi:hypothetical protein
VSKDHTSGQVILFNAAQSANLPDNLPDNPRTSFPEQYRESFIDTDVTELLSMAEACARLKTARIPFHQLTGHQIKVGLVNYYPAAGTIFIDGEKKLPTKGWTAFIDLLRARRVLNANSSNSTQLSNSSTSAAPPASAPSSPAPSLPYPTASPATRTARTARPTHYPSSTSSQQPQPTTGPQSTTRPTIQLNIKE